MWTSKLRDLSLCFRLLRYLPLGILGMYSEEDSSLEGCRGTTSWQLDPRTTGGRFFSVGGFFSTQIFTALQGGRLLKSMKSTSEEDRSMLELNLTSINV